MTAPYVALRMAERLGIGQEEAMHTGWQLLIGLTCDQRHLKRRTGGARDVRRLPLPPAWGS